MSVDHIKVQPEEFYSEHMKEGIRPDGRKLMEMRQVVLTAGSIKTANGSSVVKLGKTSIVCGIKAELTTPSTNEPEKGIIVPNVELSPLCSPKIKPGPPCDQAQVVTKFLDNILKCTGLISVEDLCIEKGQLVWVLYCDLVCLNYDGNVADSSLIALTAALQNVKLPRVTLDAESGLPLVDLESKHKLNINCLPVATTFTMFNGKYLISDPTDSEEELTSGQLTIVLDQNNKVIYVERPGGVSLSPDKMRSCISRATSRGKEVQVLYKEITTT